MDPIESETPLRNNFLEVPTGRVSLKNKLQKVFKGCIVLGCLSLALILVIFVGFKNDDETETIKQCLPGHYNLSTCSSM